MSLLPSQTRVEYFNEKFLCYHNTLFKASQYCLWERMHLETWLTPATPYVCRFYFFSLHFAPVWWLGLSVTMHTPMGPPFHPPFLHFSFSYFSLFVLLSKSASSSHYVEEAVYAFYRCILEGTNISCILFLFETYLSWANMSTISCCGFFVKNQPGWGQGTWPLLFNLCVFCLSSNEDCLSFVYWNSLTLLSHATPAFSTSGLHMFFFLLF